MIKNITILFLILILLSGAEAQVLDSQKGWIYNKGKIVIKGQAVYQQDTIGGRVEYVLDKKSVQQNIPHIAYNDIYLGGKSDKLLYDTTRPLIALRKFTSDTDAVMKMYQKAFINSEDTTVHYGFVNPDYTYGLVRMNGTNAQDVWGRGVFRELELDNTRGADVRNNGGFKVATKLELKQGDFRNSQQNNFSMGDSSTIVRWTGTSISEEPVFDKNVNVHYKGAGQIVAGPEIPTDSTILNDLTVDNSGGLVLSKNSTYKNNLYTVSNIYTEPDSLRQYVLTSTSPNNPVFASSSAEIDGRYRRKFLHLDSTITLFNNRYTYSVFPNAAAAGAAAEMTFRVKPRTFPPFLNGTSKVMRYIAITARDKNYADLQQLPGFTVGYGWRNSSDPQVNESNGLPVPNIKLQWWNGSDWTDLPWPAPATDDNTTEWAYNYSSVVQLMGDFAIGLLTIAPITLRALVMLEGAYRTGQTNMGIELKDKNLLPLTPPDIYPYNLDPRRTQNTVQQIPDSAVDWMVIEFRDELVSTIKYYVTCFLRADGKLISRNGSYPLNLSNEGINKGKYYLAIRHRNHLGIITENPVSLDTFTSAAVIDFSNPSILLGRESSLKTLALKPDNSLLFGMITGDANSDGIIDDNYDGLYDFILTWEDRDNEGYLIRDMNLQGIITTKDFNYSWNNRGRKSAIP